MKKYNIKSISLIKNYLLIILILIISLFFSYIVILLMLSRILKGNIVAISFLILSYIVAILLHRYLKKYTCKEINIFINKKELKFSFDNGERIFKINDIKKYKIKTLWISFPSFKIKYNDNKYFKFRCSNRVDDEFDKFVLEFEKIMSKSKN